MSAFKRGDQWHYRKWVRLPDGSRERIFGTPSINTKIAAERAERDHVQRLINPPAAVPAQRALPTVAEYAEGWVARRVELGIVTASDDESRLRLHAIPRIGTMRLDEVKPRHARDLVLALRTEGKYAARTILKSSATLHSMFKSAVIDELITANPVIFEPGTLPKKADKDPEWRHQAIYTREEVEALLSDDRIPADRRVLYGLKMLAALRHGEAVNLAWRQIDLTTKPLARINLGKTKSGVPRAVPVHPTLAKMLATWRLAGWFNTYGRQARPEDLIVPTLTMRPRVSQEAQDALVGDLKLLGFRVKAGVHMDRRGHDLRRTFISLALADGAHRDRLEWVTHGPRGDIMSMYTSLPWPSLCDEVSKLKINLLDGALITLRHDKPTALTVRARKRWLKPETATDWAPGGHRVAVVGANKPQLRAAVLESLVTPLGLERVERVDSEPGDSTTETIVSDVASKGSSPKP